MIDLITGAAIWLLIFVALLRQCSAKSLWGTRCPLSRYHRDEHDYPPLVWSFTFENVDPDLMKLLLGAMN